MLLLQVLHQRPHYQIAHILGYWRGIYGEADTQRLARIASNDLLHAANSMSLAREHKTAKADYDCEAAFIGCLEALRRQQQQKISANSLAILKQTDLTQLSKTELNHLVRAALANKITPTP